MKMYVSVPDTLIAQVREGDEVAVRFDALPHRKMTGKVMEIGVGSSEGSSYRSRSISTTRTRRSAPA